VGIAEAVEQVESLLTPEFPSLRLQVFRFDEQRSLLERVYPFRHDAKDPSIGSTVALSKADREELDSWVQTPRLMFHSAGGNAGHPSVASILVRAGMPETSAWIAGVLMDGAKPAGMLMLGVASDTEFSTRQGDIAERLLDPLSVALKNDWRIHELEILRNAAESEKLAALRRLGRDRPTDDIIGVHGGLRPVIERIQMVARTEIPVLLLGETGTGKEVIARLIHQQSPRVRGPFLRVNSGAIPSELIDAELFGHEKGSFTGATASRRGWFERADGGTLLLDEVGELPRPAQVRLLRVLQEGSFERVGGEKTFHVDVRVVAATHRDLAAMVQNGLFREDLWYRISGFPLVLPPLRERKQDIPELARHFARRAARIFGLMPQFPSADDLAVLMNYDWPGNIRELASVIDRAAILGEGRKLAISNSLGAVAATVRGAVAAPPPSGRGDAESQPARVDSLDDANRKHIRLALTVTQGRIEGRGGAAQLLDINPHTLRARMRKLGIDWRQFRFDRTTLP